MGEPLETSPKRKESSQKEVLKKTVARVAIFHKDDGSVYLNEISVQILKEPQKTESIEGIIENVEESSQVEGVVLIKDESEREEERSAAHEEDYDEFSKSCENNVQIEEKTLKTGNASDLIKVQSYTNDGEVSSLIEERSSKANKGSAQTGEISSKEGFAENEEISD